MTSASGAYDCGEGETCRFEVSELDFDEVFTAEGRDNYQFLCWKRRKRGFCGGRQQSCKPTTVPLASHPLLMAILASDETFYLVPVFREMDSGDGGAVRETNAGACFNPRLEAQGTTVEARYVASDPSGGGETRSALTQTVIGPTRFQGRQAMAIASELRVEAGGSEFITLSTAYVQPQTGRQRLLSLGSDAETFFDGVPAGTLGLVFKPGTLLRWDLKPG